MKESLEFLNRISKIKGLEPENYYVITIYPSFVRLQGHNNQDLRKQIEKFMTNPEIQIRDKCEYTDYRRGMLEITLTKYKKI